MSALLAKRDTVLAEEARVRWEAFLESTREGLPIEKALLQNRVTRREFELAVLNPLENRKWQEATLLAKKAAWSALDRDEVFARIGRGMKVEEAISTVRGFDDPTFFQLVEGDPDWHAQYMSAMKAKSLRDMDKLIEIADDATNDTLEGPKGTIPNMASVQRARLMVETRRELAGNFWPKLFGQQRDTVNVQVNINPAERLEAARERVKRDRAQNGQPITREEMAHAIEATFAPNEGVIASQQQPSQLNPQVVEAKDPLDE